MRLLNTKLASIVLSLTTCGAYALSSMPARAESGVIFPDAVLLTRSVPSDGALIFSSSYVSTPPTVRLRDGQGNAVDGRLEARPDSRWAFIPNTPLTAGARYDVSWTIGSSPSGPLTSTIDVEAGSAPMLDLSLLLNEEHTSEADGLVCCGDGCRPVARIDSVVLRADPRQVLSRTESSQWLVFVSFDGAVRPWREWDAIPASYASTLHFSGERSKQTHCAQLHALSLRTGEERVGPSSCLATALFSDVVPYAPESYLGVAVCPDPPALHRAEWCDLNRSACSDGSCQHYQRNCGTESSCLCGPLPATLDAGIPVCPAEEPRCNNGQGNDDVDAGPAWNEPAKHAKYSCSVQPGEPGELKVIWAGVLGATLALLRRRRARALSPCRTRLACGPSSA